MATTTEKGAGSRIGVGLALAYLALVGGGLFLAFSHWAYDDPFITYRYAANLSRGLGFVYNPGERVLSTTTPLFTLLLAGLRPLWADLPRLAILIGALSLAAGGLLLRDLARTRKAPLASWAGLLLYPTFPLLANTLGSETPLYLAFALGAFAAYARRRFPLAALLAALTALTRPDGALVAALLAVHFALRIRQPIPWRAVGVYLLPLGAWAVFATLYFGSPIPVTLAAKQGQFSLAENSGFLAGLLTLARNYLALPHYLIAGVVAVLGVGLLLRRSLEGGLLVLWTALYTASFTALQVSSYFWYYAPLIPGWVVSIGVGLSEIRARTAGLRRPGPALATALLLIIAGFQIQDLNTLRAQFDHRYPAYRAVGVWLAENTPPAAGVGTLEVGIMGYHTPNPMLDFAGLIQPAVAAQFGPGRSYEDAALWAIEWYPFEYLVLHDGLMPTLEAAVAQGRCEPAHQVPGAAYAYDYDLVIYACPP